MDWHDDPRNPTWPTLKKSRERLVPRRASSGISTSSPGSLPVEARDDGDDGDTKSPKRTHGFRARKKPAVDVRFSAAAAPRASTRGWV
jgi:hypothetical protein